jgi:hypothetical protein
MPRKTVIAFLALLVLASIGAALYRFALPGLSSARPTPPVIETQVATWLLLHSVPRETEWNLAPEIPAARLLIGLGLPDAFADDRIEIRWTDGRQRDLSRWEGRRAPGDGGLLLLSAACILTFGRAKFARADPDGPEAGPRAATPVF